MHVSVHEPDNAVRSRDTRDAFVHAILINQLLHVAGQWVYFVSMMKTFRQIENPFFDTF